MTCTACDRIAQALTAADPVGDPERFVAADVDFHFAIVQATHSALLVALHRAVLEWLREQRISSIQPSGSSEAAQRAHRRVFDAIARHDPARAERAMLAHLDEVERYYWQARQPESARADPRNPRVTPRRKTSNRRRTA